jgi:hypothetical protein
MRLVVVSILGVLATSAFGATSALASAQSRHCTAEAKEQGLSGRAAANFRAKCLKGALAPKTPTHANGSTVEARAVTAPSGANRTDRTQQCNAEADRRRLSGPSRKEFHLSCIATAGPVSEGQNHAAAPRPANAIPGIGENSKAPAPK